MTAGDDEPAEIGASGTRWALVLAVGLLAVAGVGTWVLHQVNAFLIGWAIAAAVAIAYTAVARRRDILTADTDGLVVTARGARTRYAWADVLEVGWIGAQWPANGSGIVIRPADGGPWAIPGPNNPTQVATLAVFGRAGNRRARQLLRARCETHGVPFDGNGAQMLMNAPPGSAYRVRKKVR